MCGPRFLTNHKSNVMYAYKPNRFTTEIDCLEKTNCLQCKARAVATESEHPCYNR